MNSAGKKLLKEWQALQEVESEEYEVSDPRSSGCLQWEVLIFGQEGTPYNEGMFFFNIEFPDTYPEHPPKKIKCTTKIYHPNIDSKGQICFQGLKDAWNPKKDSKSVLEFLVDLIKNPDAGDAINSDVAKIMLEDNKKFLETAKKWVEKFAN
eukprot:CAMPEP_0185254356 /NCGR_PEP_ID=MMETSP1359-20130426/3117_1 /TAXON_ID=552665 /ORGANISM="Bigelowiella longifila, Strain CCMP242" /LENGTH=151 /DNA_ID=CAMNT_0027837285 /DNA_START=38 /DNA_END=493 /DNA_ORIENTATION=+